jgi:hypothetical protein
MRRLSQSRIVHSQRLSRYVESGARQDGGLGDEVHDREALLEYLVANHGDDKPAPKVEMSK